MVQPHELIEARNANVRHNQIGGRTDGVDSEVMADLGYETPERTLEIIASMGEAASTHVAPKIKEEAPAVVTRDVPARSPVSRSGLSAQGKLLADREPDTAHDPAYQEPVILTAAEKAAGKRGMEIMKQALAEERAQRQTGSKGAGE